MTPGEIRGKTLSELRRARRDMLSAEWLSAVRDLPEAERSAAAAALLDVCLAVRDLENARVAAIRGGLVEGANDLERGLQALERARRRLDRTEPYLKAVTRLTAMLARVLEP